MKNEIEAIHKYFLQLKDSAFEVKELGKNRYCLYHIVSKAAGQKPFNVITWWPSYDKGFVKYVLQYNLKEEKYLRSLSEAKALDHKLNEVKQKLASR